MADSAHSGSNSSLLDHAERSIEAILHPYTSYHIEKPPRLSESQVRQISERLSRLGKESWSRVPRIYTVLRLVQHASLVDDFINVGVSDLWFPFSHKTLPDSLRSQSARHEFLEIQDLVLTKAFDLEREDGKHRHFSRGDEVPLQKLEELGKGAFGFVDRVISTITYKEYARKLIPRGKTFKKNAETLRDFERELSHLKKLSHRHIIELVGSYTDSKYVGLLMAPVADYNLKDFLARDILPTGERSFLRTFYGCLAAALCYLHEQQVRHKDIKPQNVLVKGHQVFLTDFGISLDWTDLGQSTTTGTAVMTPRYCPPEVAEYLPRNSLSDTWSLGCVFLEVWTVLKGRRVSSLISYLETHGSGSSCYYRNLTSVQDWCKELEACNTNLDEQPPRYWISNMLQPNVDHRWTAQQLVKSIEEVNENPENRYAFSGICCIDEHEDTISSSSSSKRSSRILTETGASSIEVYVPKEMSTNRVAVVGSQNDPTSSLTVRPSLIHTLAETELEQQPSSHLNEVHDTNAQGTQQTVYDVGEGSTTEADRGHGAIDKARHTDREYAENNTAQIHSADETKVVNVGLQPEIEMTATSHSNIDQAHAHTTSLMQQDGALAGEDVHSKEEMSPLGVTGHRQIIEDTMQNESHMHRRFSWETRSGVRPKGMDEGSSEDEIVDLVSAVEPRTDLTAQDLQRFWARKDTEPIDPHSSLEEPFAEAIESPTPVTRANESYTQKSSVIHPPPATTLEQDSPSTATRLDPRTLRTPLDVKSAMEFRKAQPPKNADVSETRLSLQSDGATQKRSRLSNFLGTFSRNKRSGGSQDVKVKSTSEYSQSFEKPDNAISSAYAGGATESASKTNDVIPSLSASSDDIEPVKPARGRICNKCGQALTGQFVRALDGTFHLECFSCQDCGMIVATSFFPVDGSDGGPQVPLCERDYFRRLDLLCHSCDKALRGSYITAAGQKYHIEHFTCSECDLVFGVQDSYYEHEGIIYCLWHYCLKWARLCKGCGVPILKQFVEIARNGEEQQWHPECYMINKYWNISMLTEKSHLEISQKRFGDLSSIRSPSDAQRARLSEEHEMMEVRKDRIWSVLSNFEETSAAQVADVLASCHDGKSIIEPLAKLLYCVRTLFTAHDTIDSMAATYSVSVETYVREAKLLCKKIVAVETLVSQEPDTNRSSQEYILEFTKPITGIAHYLKLLIRIGLKNVFKIEEEHPQAESVEAFLRTMEQEQVSKVQGSKQNRAVSAYVARFQAMEQNQSLSDPISDICKECGKPVDNACFVSLESDTQRWHLDCVACEPCKTMRRKNVPGTENWIVSSTTDRSLVCSKCRSPPASHLVQVGVLLQYMFLLEVSLYRLKECIEAR